MNRLFLGFLVIVFGLSLPLAAQGDDSPAAKNPEKAAKKWLDENAWPVDYDEAGTWADYGEKLFLEAKDLVGLKDFAAKPDAYTGKKIRLEGHITAICAKAGCWLSFTDGEQDVFVKFKDYGFFVPRHLAGHDVIVEGLAERVVFTEAQRKHMAEDAGKSPEEIAAIVGDETRLKMMAEAVRIRRPAVIELGRFDAKAKERELKELDGEPARISGVVVAAEKGRIGIENAGRRLELSLPGDGLDEEQLERLKKATKPVKVEACGRVVAEGGPFVVAGIRLHVGH
ncbi:MAG: DUF4920 domain-containing protein [Planctomycetes bacterium]|nr:DUF4920 domain-containing protein [Planctomycetota bacterium]